jgi:hypothetical protein
MLKFKKNESKNKMKEECTMAKTLAAYTEQLRVMQAEQLRDKWRDQQQQ